MKWKAFPSRSFYHGIYVGAPPTLRLLQTPQSHFQIRNFVCIYMYVCISFFLKGCFSFFWSLRLAFSLTIFCVSVVTITAHNGQLLWTVKRTMELPPLSRMSNRQPVRFTSGQLCTSLCSLLRLGGFEAKTCAAEVYLW